MRRKIVAVLLASGISGVLFPFSEYIFGYQLTWWVPPVSITVGLLLVLAAMIVDVTQ